MKTFLIAAGILMTGASVYGVVDFNNRQRTKEFRELYNEGPKQEVVTAPGKEVPANTVIKNLNTETEKMEGVNKESSKTEVKKTSYKKPVVRKKKNRTLRLKEFSRAPLKG